MSSGPFIFFFNDTATTEIYTLSLHDALPIARAAWSTPLFESLLGSPGAPGGEYPSAREVTRRACNAAARISLVHLEKDFSPLRDDSRTTGPSVTSRGWLHKTFSSVAHVPGG